MYSNGVSYTLDIPFVARFQKPLAPNQLIAIKGYALGKKFEINLCTNHRVAGSKCNDVALHISCRAGLRKKKIFFNSLVEQKWGQRETAKYTFTKREEFELKIRTLDDSFQVFANGQEVMQYKHRAPLNSVASLYIDGEIELNRVSWEGRQFAVPFETPLADWDGGRLLHVAGALKPDAVQFAINFYADNDIAFHFNPRLKDNEICLNSQRDGRWEEEIFCRKFPFGPARTFDLYIQCNDDSFVAIINNDGLCDFLHRFPPETINKLVIQGDLDIHSVHW